MNQRKPPLLPDGSEFHIGLLVAAAIGLYMVFNNYPMWSYLLAVSATFLGCVYGIQIWSEDDRQYWKAMRLRGELTQLLDHIRRDTKGVRSAEARKNITSGLADAHLIIGELLKQKPTRLYGGLTQLAPHIRRMFPVVSEYVDIQDHPGKAGAKRDDLMRKAEQGFQGFREEMARMLARVNGGDIFDLTTNAELLRSLRNLLGQSRQENKS